MTIIEWQNVSYGTDQKMILADVSLQVNEGDYIAIVGPSGSGKSTFLKLCSNLISPTSGEIFYQGKNFLEYSPIELRKEIGYCFQTPYLFGDTVRENINFPYEIREVTPDQGRIEELFGYFEMSPSYLDRSVQNLSGGEKQRISLIRSLLFAPKVLLLDEITSALDADNANIVERVIATLHGEGTTILWVTHNPDQIRGFANRTFRIEAGKVLEEEVVR